MKKWQMAVLLALVAVLSAGVGAYAAANYGSESDPLVTVSYLNQVLGPSIQGQFDSQINGAMEVLEQRFESQLGTAAGTFAVVSLPAGKTLSGSAGCEILYRSGGATAAAELVDLTSGTAVASGGSLTANHLYMASADGVCVTATGAATLMVRGDYTVA